MPVGFNALYTYLQCFISYLRNIKQNSAWLDLDLGHTRGTRLAETGFYIGAISKMLGHSSSDVGLEYVQPKDILRKAIEDLERLIGSVATKITASEELEKPK
jgi:integrase